MSLTEEDVLEIGYVIKELQTPSPRVRRDMREAISRHQSQLIWNFLSRYKVPELFRVRRGEAMSPLSLLLQSPYLVDEDTRLCPPALESLLLARCSPNQCGYPARAPLSIAVEINDQESVMELLAYRANPNLASEGEDPPLCVAIQNRRRNIARTLLLFRADASMRSLSLNPPAAEGQMETGCTPLELAHGDQFLVEMLPSYCGTPGEVVPHVNETVDGNGN